VGDETGREEMKWNDMFKHKRKEKSKRDLPPCGLMLCPYMPRVIC